MNEEQLNVILQYVDYIQPELTPYEASVFIYLLRHSYLSSGNTNIRVGKRTIAGGYGKGSRGETTNYTHISKVLKQLEDKGYIKVGDTNRDGTNYIVLLPSEIPSIAEKIAISTHAPEEGDYFTDPEKRKIIFDEDNWTFQYCGEKVTENNATLDHYIPQCNNGNNSKENLRTSCIICNSVKSGKSYEEAAPLILKSIQERKSRSNE